MREAWRWFGKADSVTLDTIRQTGATDVVCSLYHVSAGERWPEHEVASLKATIESTRNDVPSLRWRVVESLPVHEDIKLGKGNRDKYIERWIETIACLARHEIEVICYNFMPVIDWTRTDLSYRLPSGAYALRFDQRACAVFDLHILKRSTAAADYPVREVKQARRDFARMTEVEVATLARNVIAGLPGRSTNSYDLASFRDALEPYKSIDRQTLEENLAYFISRVAPHAERLGIRLAIHPDDPPWSLFGLPRVVCSAQDIERIMESCPSHSNGLAFCAGTLGSHVDNDVPEIATRFGERIYFAHLRNVRSDADEPRSFIESGHLDGDIDLIRVIEILLRQERKAEEQCGERRHKYIRPDHGLEMMDDVGKSNKPGYSAIGRLKGLAEVRGVIRTIETLTLAGR